MFTSLKKKRLLYTIKPCRKLEALTMHIAMNIGMKISRQKAFIHISFHDFRQSHDKDLEKR